jgi:hypothetical protein
MILLCAELKVLLSFGMVSRVAAASAEVAVSQY